jgi:hypothetical protein
VHMAGRMRCFCHCCCLLWCKVVNAAWHTLKTYQLQWAAVHAQVQLAEHAVVAAGLQVLRPCEQFNQI